MRVIAIHVKCVKIRRKNLIAHILGMAKEILFKFWLWPPLSGGHLHCKFGAIWIRNHGATDAWQSRLCCSCQYTHSVCARPFSWAAQHTTVCLDSLHMCRYVLTCSVSVCSLCLFTENIMCVIACSALSVITLWSYKGSYSFDLHWNSCFNFTWNAMGWCSTTQGVL